MQQDLLVNLVDRVCYAVAAFDKEGMWPGLVNHFLQTYGPPDSRTAVYAMLQEAASEERARNLQQRIQILVVAWQRAQSYLGVHPEMDVQGAACPPYHCSPCIPKSSAAGHVEGAPPPVQTDFVAELLLPHRAPPAYMKFQSRF